MLFSVLITIIHGNMRADTAYTLFDPPYYFPLLSPSLLLRKTIFCVKDKLIHFPNIYRSLENGYFTIITSSIKRRKYFTFRLDFTSWCWFCLNEKMNHAIFINLPMINEQEDIQLISQHNVSLYYVRVIY